tara:strand:+ start:940 stop:2175 length:1236 start_codon:yes stop_codon:yes gene_type:complete
MARKKKAADVKIENVTTAKLVDEQPKVNEQPDNKIPEPKVEEKKVEEKVSKKETANEVKDDGTIKVDLDKWAKLNSKEEPKEELVQEVTPEETTEVKDTPVVEEITEIEVEEKVEEVKEEVVEAIKESKETGVKIPENIQKVVDFLEETGGTLEDYVSLNKDYTKMSDTDLLSEYFKNTKPHLNDEERVFVMEDLYSYDEEVDDPKDIKRKKLALKEQVANAKSHLDGQKSKYYAEVKAGSRLNPEQQKAVDFFNRYEQNTKVAEENLEVFQEKTNQVFNDTFKGFEYNVGEKRFRLNIGDADKIKNTQSDINNFVNKFTNKDTHQITNAKGYHKSLFTAMNPDLVANHFYQQGKADAIKDSMAKAKNVDMSPRQQHGETVEAGGMKVRAISGNNSSDFKVKIGRNANKIS